MESCSNHSFSRPCWYITLFIIVRLRAPKGTVETHSQRQPLPQSTYKLNRQARQRGGGKIDLQRGSGLWRSHSKLMSELEIDPMTCVSYSRVPVHWTTPNLYSVRNSNQLPHSTCASFQNVASVCFLSNLSLKIMPVQAWDCCTVWHGETCSSTDTVQQPS